MKKYGDSMGKQISMPDHSCANAKSSSQSRDYIRRPDLRVKEPNVRTLPEMQDSRNSDLYAGDEAAILTMRVKFFA